MNVSILFFDVATEDLTASRVLYDHGFYPHSVFFFQQSIEKTTKAIGLLFGLIKEEDLTSRKIGHHSFKIFSDLNTLFQNDINMDFIENCSEVEENDFEIEYEDWKSISDFLSTQIDQIDNQKFDFHKLKMVGYNDLVNILSSIDSEGPLCKMIKLDMLVDSNDFRIEQEVRSNPEVYGALIRSLSILVLLSSIFDRHFYSYRYPSLDTYKIPSSVFNEENPIIKILPQLFAKLSIAQQIFQQTSKKVSLHGL